MDRKLIIKALVAIKSGRTFERSRLPQTLGNKILWDELKSELTNGYSIDLPKETDKLVKCRA